MCPICEDARQWVPEDGQRWTTREALGENRRHDVRPDGAFEQTLFDGAGRAVAQYVPSGASFDYALDPTSATTNVYSRNGWLSDTIDPIGQRTNFIANGFGETVVTRVYRAGESTVHRRTPMLRDKLGRVVEQSDSVTGLIVRTTYDPHGNAVRVRRWKSEEASTTMRNPLTPASFRIDRPPWTYRAGTTAISSSANLPFAPSGSRG